MQPRPDLLDARSPSGLEVFQITSESLPSSHVYMEAQIFTPDSRRFVLHRSASAHGGRPDDPEHRYLLCDLEDGGRLTPLTNETGATGPSVSPDGRFLYYFVDQTRLGGGSLTLRRVRLDGTDRQTIAVIDAPLPGTSFRPSRIYPLSTLSSDGSRIAISAFLGDGSTEGGPWGLMVFDIASGAVRLVLSGTSWCNMHPQYSRSLEAPASHDILVQENHGHRSDAQGRNHRLVGGLGADIHVVRDDGQGFRNLPWGRDGVEQCQGHQCWRGRSEWAITTTVTAVGGGGREHRLIEGRALPHWDHDGLCGEGAVRNELSREIRNPNFFHFATDIAGRRFITDGSTDGERDGLYVAQLGQPGQDPLLDFRFLLHPRSSGVKTAHVHPFLSPDGQMGFFNSDESGVLQAYMVRGF